LDWDDPFPTKLVENWLKWRADHTLQKIQLQRFVANLSDNLELHGFSDASTKAYAAVVYSRVTSGDGSISESLVAAKTRLAPLKQESLPRLELCAALLGQLRHKNKTPGTTRQQCSPGYFMHQPTKDFCWKQNLGNLNQIHLTVVEWTYIATGQGSILNKIDRLMIRLIFFRETHSRRNQVQLFGYSGYCNLGSSTRLADRTSFILTQARSHCRLCEAIHPTDSKSTLRQGLKSSYVWIE